MLFDEFPVTSSAGLLSRRWEPDKAVAWTDRNTQGEPEGMLEGPRNIYEKDGEGGVAPPPPVYRLYDNASKALIGR